MQESLSGSESSAAAKKLLAKVHKLLAIASSKRHGVALRDYREALEECMKTEASSTMKVLGYRLASRNLSCSTHDTWQALLEACVMELGGTQNASVLLHAIPALELVPLPLVLSFLLATEKEPMNKLRAVLTHEQDDVRYCAITTLSKLTMQTAVAIKTDALYAFPFESHEARICCQQDLWSIVTDVWKLLFQTTLLAPNDSNASVIGAAFSAMRMLFAKHPRMQDFRTPLAAPMTTPTTNLNEQSAINDLIAAVLKDAYPRVRALVAAAQRLSIKAQVDAIWWIAMLVYLMMERTGAVTPGISVPYLDIDVFPADDAGDDDDDKSSTERVRMDQYSAGLVECWMWPLLGRKTSLQQATTLCRSVFLILAHPLHKFTRLKWAGGILQHIMAQCYHHKNAEAKQEVSQLLVRVFSWLSSSDCLTYCVPAIEALSTIERDSDRLDLLQALTDAIGQRTIDHNDFLLLEGICALDFFRAPPGSSKISPRANGAHAFQCLVRSLVDLHNRATTSADRSKVQMAQFIALRAFEPLLHAKTKSSATAQGDQSKTQRLRTATSMSYVVLLTSHFQNVVRDSKMALPESLAFLQDKVLAVFPQIPLPAVRIQVIWIVVQLAVKFQSVPWQRVLGLLLCEARASFPLADDDDSTPEGAPTASLSSFDDGKLGGDAASAVANTTARTGLPDGVDIGSLSVFLDCLQLAAVVQPISDNIQTVYERIRGYVTGHAECMLIKRMVDEPRLATSVDSQQVAASRSLIPQETFHPSFLFGPRKYNAEIKSSAKLYGVDGSTFEKLVTGGSDAFALQVSYRQPYREHEEIIVLSVACTNMTNLPMSDFEIHVRCLGAAKCIDPSNDAKIRMLQAGSASGSGNLPSHGTIKGEKRFQLKRFGQATFTFQIILLETDSSGEDGDSQVVRVPLAPSEPFVVRLDALFRAPSTQFATGASFHSIWQSTEANTVIPVRSSDAAPAADTASLSLAQRLLKFSSSRLVVVQELLIDLPVHVHIAFVTKTRWDDFVAVSVSLVCLEAGSLGLPAKWTGTCEVRSTATNVAEVEKCAADVLHIVSGSYLEQDVSEQPICDPLATSAPFDRTTTLAAPSIRTASRTTSNVSKRSDPFGAPPVSSPFDFPAVPPSPAAGNTGGGGGFGDFGDPFGGSGASKWTPSAFDPSGEVRPPASTSAVNSDPWEVPKQPTRQSVDATAAIAGARAMGDHELADDEENRVYRPLLFNSRGYESSTLWGDDYEMRTRLPEERQTEIDVEAERPRSGVMARLQSLGNSSARRAPLPASPRRHEPIQPHIRLETLSSSAATTVLWMTYLSFVFAVALPYLQSQGFLATEVPLPGDLCVNRGMIDVPCTHVDDHRHIAVWSAFVNNVSWYAGSIELRLRVEKVINTTTATADMTPIGLNALWPLGPASFLDSSNETELTVLDEGYVLQYDVSLYGIDFDSVPLSKQWITTEKNQSIWVHCGANDCNTVRLLEVAQDFEGLGSSGYGSYLVTMTYHGMYPNRFGKKVTYEFAYTKPAIHISEVIIRSGMLVATLLSLPCWAVSVYNFHGSWRNVLPVQKWVFALGFVLMLWQNPVYAAAEWYKNVSLRTRFVSDTCESFAESFFYVFWLNLMDHHGGHLIHKLGFGFALFGIDTGMTILHMPKLFFSENSGRHKLDQLYVLLGFLRIALLLGWLVWIVRISWRTSSYLRSLRYMASRFQQLSYRFLFLETFLILVYVLMLSGLQVFYLLQTWYLLGYEAFLQTAVHTFTQFHSGRPSLGKFIFLSVYVYLVMYVHLPPALSDGGELLGSTAYHVDERPRVDKYGFLMPDSHIFCVETALWLLEIAWQAYYDPPGRPSPFGYGELNLEQYGFELITHLRSNLTDTHAVVASNHDHKRLVIAFRGTTSKQNWKSNLRFHQDVVWIKSRGGIRRDKTCMERLKDCAAKIPILNMALPRVHSGFWKAYASVRTELKEVVRLVMDENPGITVYVTGHSMGGALAVLAAYDLAANFSIKVHMYNFGGPRVGNPSFGRHYDRIVPSSYRVVMDGDIVPGVPRFWGLYQHVGTEVAIDAEGNLIVDPSFVERQLHVSSKRKVATHLTHVYRASMAKCLENLIKLNVCQCHGAPSFIQTHSDVRECSEVAKMAQYEDQQACEGVIRSHVEFAEAAANGSKSMVEFLLENGARIDMPGRDGTTPLCAAALWGNDAMVALLLDRGADITARNEGTGWTALHAAAFQEHGKVVRILLDRGADAKAVDTEGRTPVDYASISEAIWPFFAARGYKKSSKSDLIAKGIIRKVLDQPEQAVSYDKQNESISYFSRPGSAYVRAQVQPPVAARRQDSAKTRDVKGPIDPLGDDAPPSRPSSNQRRPSFQGLGL
ncbi:TPA: hypothetical protein N0F65_006958 [Lagenidium giganteum]|uniref:Fungal lipase-like domain-containing protein n=1 Tax=Lagenidium giganteum TaxID=4803 RepID=A0AAV2ZFT7_9STRA|nr:TPA: hypothetical protein N0F65_006958 [Lagenidium giganteum]